MKNSSWRQLRGIVLGAGVVLCATLGTLAILLTHQPAFYRQALAADDGGPEEQARARRMVTKASAFYAAVSRPAAGGDMRPAGWETAVRDDEVNAWLALDLPRSHPTWLPRGVAAPRVAFRPRHAAIGVRLGYGPLATTASIDLEVVLRDINQIGVVLEQARVGAIPLPRSAIARALARRLDALGLVTDLRRLDGRLVLVVHVPSSHDAGASSHRIETLSLADGELLMAGTTRVAAAARPAGAGPPP